MPTAAGYVRVSRDKSKHGLVEEIVSPTTQKEFFTRYAQMRGWDLPTDLVFEDLDYSGFRIHYSKRPGLMELMRLAEQGKFQYLLIYKIARLARRLREFLEIYEFFEKHGVAIVSVTESVDTSTPHGRAALAMMAVFAQLQSEELAEYISNTKRTQANQGIMPGTRSPYGTVRRGGKITKHPDQFPHLEAAFRMAAEGKSAPQIRKYFEENGVPAPDGAQWWDNVIYDILKNPVYAGKFRFGGQVRDGRHEPLIDPSLWQKVQRELGKRREIQAARRHRLLSGLIYCGRCGAPYNVHHGGGNANRFGYQCRQRFRGDGCKAPRLDAVTLEEAVRRRVKDLVTNEAVIRRAAKRLEAREPTERKALEKERARLERELGELKRALDALYDDHYRRRAIPADQFERKTKEYADLAQTQEANLALVNDKLANAGFALTSMTQARAALTGLVEVWNKLPVEEIQALLLRSGVRITTRPDGVVLSMLGLEDIVPGKAHISTLYFDDGYQRARGSFWSRAEDKFLVGNWSEHDAKWVGAKLGRPEKGVRQRVLELRKKGVLGTKRKAKGS